MADKFLSPGVFTQENDQSYLAQGVGNIGAAFIGPTTKGRAYIPTEVTSYSEFEQKFGVSLGESYLPYSVKEYLTNAGSATIVRILGEGGYVHNDTAQIIMSGSYGNKVVGILHRSTSTEKLETNETLTPSTINFVNTGSFFITVSGSITNEKDIYTGSLHSTSQNFLGKLFSTEPKTNDVAYAYKLFKNSISNLLTIDGGSVLSMQFKNLDLSYDYQPAFTPFIISQTIGGSVTPLFRFRTIGDGVYANNEIKISISGIKFANEVPSSDYGIFTVTVRDINDTDKNQTILEQFTNVSLDPDSSNYIARVIGDKYPNITTDGIVFEGNYENKSNYIIVEMNSAVEQKSINPELVPFGFQALVENTVNYTNSYYPTAAFVNTQEINGNYSNKVFYGFNFDFVNTDNKNYFGPIQDTATIGNNIDFSLNNYTVHASASTDAGLPIINTTTTDARKFSIPLQGGFDGYSPANFKAMEGEISQSNSQGFDFTNSTSSGSVAYVRAINLLSNSDQYDMNLLFTPGLIYEYHPYIIEYALAMCEDRADVFYVFDCSSLNSNVASAISTVSGIDSNYCSTYFPWCKVLDVNRNKYLWCPPGVIIPGVYSYNDKVGFEWFAPAGLNRGKSQVISDLRQNLNKSQRDNLYVNRINPIGMFPREGAAIFGQKTLQSRSSALDRISVRRLLISVKKYIASSARYLIFEQNTQTLQNQFVNLVSPYLDGIQQNSGLYAFRVQCDQELNNSETVDRNILKASVFLQPTKTAEYIDIQFNITPSGVEFV